MEKEILTLEDIRYDLRRDIKSTYIALAIVTPIFLVLFLLFIVVVRTQDPLSLALVGYAIFLAMFLILIIFGVARIVNTHIILKNNKFVVTKDYLVGKAIHSYRRHVSFVFTFGRYGAFTIPSENYTWSKLHCKTDDMVYNGSKCDDEFYLVLSKKDKGLILMAYNTKLFEYQE